MEYLSIVFAIMVFYNKDIYFFINRIYLTIILLITETFFVVVQQRNVKEAAIDCCSAKAYFSSFGKKA